MTNELTDVGFHMLIHYLKIKFLKNKKIMQHNWRGTMLKDGCHHIKNNTKATITIYRRNLKCICTSLIIIIRRRKKKEYTFTQYISPLKQSSHHISSHLPIKNGLLLQTSLHTIISLKQEPEEPTPVYLLCLCCWDSQSNN